MDTAIDNNTGKESKANIYRKSKIPTAILFECPECGEKVQWIEPTKKQPYFKHWWGKAGDCPLATQKGQKQLYKKLQKKYPHLIPEKYYPAYLTVPDNIMMIANKWHLRINTEKGCAFSQPDGRWKF